ncbi:glycosyltransferase family 2 protein [Armatimonas rosea]|uniref:Glycosyltransferase involved in cell wall biosynthesis n=1 Tax=Armatimonas rosea TaxID=685828 RepID=A0A7W9ST15_ARMRO|nr:glycosyltransferase family 2 protein [Armatimonas rosea]MBB6051743.1 glycosyltransferase involved in cell wall biosynthesis [Armatimonas rosea]
MSRETVAVVIPTYNVAAIIRPTLESIRWADEIIIVDMFSDDGTKELVEAYPNVRYFGRKDYIFANVNYGMEQATTDWVIRLDSDEVLGEELQKAIQAFLEKPDPSVKTLLFRGVHRFFGFPSYQGVYREEACWRKHMFRKGTAAYPCKAEHEDIESQEPTQRLAGHYDHFTNMTAEEVVRKFNYYTSKDVERMSDSELEPMSPGKLLYRCTRMFILYYFQWKGYKEGQFGFYTALFRGPIYTIIEQVKRWERLEKQRRG